MKFITSPENLVDEVSRKKIDEELEQDTLLLQKNVENIKNLNKKETIYVCKTSPILEICGAKEHDIKITYNTLLNETLSETEHAGNHSGGHELNKLHLSKLVKALSNPLAIGKSPKYEDALVIFTTNLNTKGEKIIISLRLDKNEKTYYINEITSMYGKKNYDTYLEEKVIKIGNLLAYNTEKANTYQESSRVYFPSDDDIIGFDNNIPYLKEEVKKQIIEGTFVANTDAIDKEVAVTEEPTDNGILYDMDMTLASIERNYGSVAEYFRQQNEREPYEPTDAELEETERQLKQREEELKKYDVEPSDIASQCKTIMENTKIDTKNKNGYYESRKQYTENKLKAIKDIASFYHENVDEGLNTWDAIKNNHFGITLDYEVSSQIYRKQLLNLDMQTFINLYADLDYARLYPTAYYKDADEKMHYIQNVSISEIRKYEFSRWGVTEEKENKPMDNIREQIEKNDKEVELLNERNKELYPYTNPNNEGFDEKKRDEFYNNSQKITELQKESAELSKSIGDSNTMEDSISYDRDMELPVTEYVYYSYARPVSIGTYPKANLIEFENYDNRTMVDDAGREVWAKLRYSQPLTDKQLDEYEFVASQNDHSDKRFSVTYYNGTLEPEQYYYSSFDEAKYNFFKAHNYEKDGYNIYLSYINSESNRELCVASYNWGNRSYSYTSFPESEKVGMEGVPFLTLEKYVKKMNNHLFIEEAMVSHNINVFESCTKGNDVWGAWLTKISSPEHPEDYIEIETEGVSRLNLLTTNVNIVKNNQIKEFAYYEQDASKMLESKNFEDFEDAPNDFMDALFQYAFEMEGTMTVYSNDIDRMENVQPYDEHYNLLENNGFDKFPKHADSQGFTIPPTVTIPFTESPYFLANETMSIEEAERRFLNAEAKAVKDLADGGYYKTDFVIKYVYNGIPNSYHGRIDIGDGSELSLIDHIEKHVEYMIDHPNDLGIYTEEQVQERLKQASFVKNNLIPHLKDHQEVIEEKKAKQVEEKEMEENSSTKKAIKQSLKAEAQEQEEEENANRQTLLDSISNIEIDQDGYVHFTIVSLDEYLLNGLYRTHDTANGEDNSLVSIEYGYDHPEIEKYWNDIESRITELVNVDEQHFKVSFEFRGEDGEWHRDSLSNNGEGFTLADAKDVFHQLKNDEVNTKRYLSIQPMTEEDFQPTIIEETQSEKQRVFFDLDGVCALWQPVAEDELYEEGYYRNLPPYENVVKAINDITQENPEVEVYVLSKYLTGSKYALKEKEEWVKEHLPNIPVENQIFVPYSKNKFEYIPDGLRETDYLIDDYTNNFEGWQPPAKAIKLLNGINNTKGTWQGAKISAFRDSESLKNALLDVIKNGAEIKDLPPQLDNSFDYEAFFDERQGYKYSNFADNHQEMLADKNKQYNNRTTIVINAFGGAGAGKTVACMDICQQLKKQGYNAEYVSEYCKDLVYENSDMLSGTAKNQFKILQEQMRRVDRLIGQVDFVVTDSPILLNSIYNKELTPEYEEMVTSLFNQYDNFTFVVERDKTHFQTEGRIHTLEESIEKDNEIKNMLHDKDIYFGTYNHDTIHKVVNNSIRTFERISKEQEQAQKVETGLKITGFELKNMVYMVNYTLNGKTGQSAIMEQAGQLYFTTGSKIAKDWERHDFTKEQSIAYRKFVNKNMTAYQFPPEEYSSQIDADRIEAMYNYETEQNIASADRVTEWFADYDMAILKTGITLEDFINKYSEVFYASTQDSLQITEDTKQVHFNGYKGTYYTINSSEIDGKIVFLMESEDYGDEVACLVVDADGNILFDKEMNGFDDYKYHLSTIREELAEKIIKDWEEENNTKLPQEKEMPIYDLVNDDTIPTSSLEGMINQVFDDIENTIPTLNNLHIVTFSEDEYGEPQVLHSYSMDEIDKAFKELGKLDCKSIGFAWEDSRFGEMSYPVYHHDRKGFVNLDCRIAYDPFKTLADLPEGQTIVEKIANRYGKENLKVYITSSNMVDVDEYYKPTQNPALQLFNELKAEQEAGTLKMYTIIPRIKALDTKNNPFDIYVNDKHINLDFAEKQDDGSYRAWFDSDTETRTDYYETFFQEEISEISFMSELGEEHLWFEMPEEVQLEMLVRRIDNLMYEYDTYEYNDQYPSREIGIDETLHTLTLRPEFLLTTLNTMIEEADEPEKRKIESLIKEIRDYQGIDETQEMLDNNTNLITEYITIKEAGLDWGEDTIIRDFGYISGLARSYNLEYQNLETGETSWGSGMQCDFTMDSMIKDNYVLEELAERGWKLTGRAIFRGYDIERYDADEGYEYLENVDKQLVDYLTENDIFFKVNCDPNKNAENNIATHCVTQSSQSTTTILHYGSEEECNAFYEANKGMITDENNIVWSLSVEEAEINYDIKELTRFIHEYEEKENEEMARPRNVVNVAIEKLLQQENLNLKNNKEEIISAISSRYGNQENTFVNAFIKELEQDASSDLVKRMCNTIMTSTDLESLMKRSEKAIMDELNTDNVCIYQIIDNPKMHYVDFMDYKHNIEGNSGLLPDHYVLVHSEPRNNRDLEKIFMDMQDTRANRSNMHSLSVSDIVAVWDKNTNTRKLQYVDSFGFEEVKDFDIYKSFTYLTPEEQMATPIFAETRVIDPLSNNVNLDGAYHRSTWQVLDTKEQDGKAYLMLVANDDYSPSNCVITDKYGNIIKGYDIPENADPKSTWDDFFKTSDTLEESPVTEEKIASEKQKAFAENIAKVLNLPMPEEQTANAYSKFIKDNLKEYNKIPKSTRKELENTLLDEASASQIKFAQTIANTLKIDLPEGNRKADYTYFISKYRNEFSEALKSNPNIAESEPLKSEAEYLEMVTKNGSAIKDVPKEARTEQIIETALSSYGAGIRYLREDEITEKLCLVAVKQYGKSLRHVPPKMRTFEVCLEAYSSDHGCLNDIPKEIKKDVKEEYNNRHPEQIESKEESHVHLDYKELQNTGAKWADDIKDILDNGLDNPEAIFEAIEFAGKFYQYSYLNMSLMRRQNRGITYVGTKSHFNKLGYSVNAEQEPMFARLPLFQNYVKDPVTKQRILSNNYTKEIKEKIEKGELKEQSYVKSFIFQYAFYDISQTDCPPEDYPKLFNMGYPSEVHSQLFDAMEEFATEYLGYDVCVKDLSSISLRGSCNYYDKVININKLLNNSESLGTLAHEIGHAILHGENAESYKPTEQKEVEADILSIMIQTNLGLPISDVRKRHLINNYNTLVEIAEKNGESVSLYKMVDYVQAQVFRKYITQMNTCISNHVPQPSATSVAVDLIREKAYHDVIYLGQKMPDVDTFASLMPNFDEENLYKITTEYNNKYDYEMFKNVLVPKYSILKANRKEMFESGSPSLLTYNEFMEQYNTPDSLNNFVSHLDLAYVENTDKDTIENIEKYADSFNIDELASNVEQGNIIAITEDSLTPSKLFFVDSDKIVPLENVSLSELQEKKINTGYDIDTEYYNLSNLRNVIELEGDSKEYLEYLEKYYNYSNENSPVVERPEPILSKEVQEKVALYTDKLNTIATYERYYNVDPSKRIVAGDSFNGSFNLNKRVKSVLDIDHAYNMIQRYSEIGNGTKYYIPIESEWLGYRLGVITLNKYYEPEVSLVLADDDNLMDFDSIEDIQDYYYDVENSHTALLPLYQGECHSDLELEELLNYAMEHTHNVNYTPSLIQEMTLDETKEKYRQDGLTEDSMVFLSALNNAEKSSYYFEPSEEERENINIVENLYHLFDTTEKQASFVNSVNNKLPDTKNRTTDILHLADELIEIESQIDSLLGREEPETDFYKSISGIKTVIHSINNGEKLDNFDMNTLRNSCEEALICLHTSSKDLPYRTEYAEREALNIIKEIKLPTRQNYIAFTGLEQGKVACKTLHYLDGNIYDAELGNKTFAEAIEEAHNCGFVEISYDEMTEKARQFKRNLEMRREENLPESSPYVQIIDSENVSFTKGQKITLFDMERLANRINHEIADKNKDNPNYYEKIKYNIVLSHDPSDCITGSYYLGAEKQNFFDTMQSEFEKEYDKMVSTNFEESIVNANKLAENLLNGKKDMLIEFNQSQIDYISEHTLKPLKDRYVEIGKEMKACDSIHDPEFKMLTKERSAIVKDIKKLEENVDTINKEIQESIFKQADLSLSLDALNDIKMQIGNISLSDISQNVANRVQQEQQKQMQQKQNAMMPEMN